jgi:predicted nucleic acid-binding protein
MYLVVDTWVWKTAGQKTEESLESLELLAKICRICHKIIYDYEEEILDEYRRCLEGSPIRHMFKIMTERGKIVPKSRSRVNIESFDKSDLKFIQVALSVPGSIIITGDSDFLQLRELLKRDKKLKKTLHGIQIYTPKEALNSNVL